MPEPEFASFSEYLRFHRKRLGWTQEELAEKSGISQSYVSGLERGINKEPEPEKLEGIAAGIGRPRAEVFRMAGRAPRTTSELTREPFDDPDIPLLIEGYIGLASSDREFIKNAIEHLRQKSRNNVIGARTDDETTE